MNDALKLLNLLLKCRLIRTLCCQGLEMIILFPQRFDLDSLLIVCTLEQLTYIFELGSRASLLLTEFNGVTWLTGELVTSQLFGVISNLVDFRLVLVLHYCGKLRSLQFVVFEVCNSFLQPSVLQVESFLLKA